MFVVCFIVNSIIAWLIELHLEFSPGRQRKDNSLQTATHHLLSEGTRTGKMRVSQQLY